jgi:hypothetical protein
VPRPRREKITEQNATVPRLVREVRTLRDYFEKFVPPEHGNVSLHEQDALILMLCGFFDPMARSLRTLEELGQVPSVKQHLGVDQVPKSTLSDALARFRVEHLRPLMQQLKKQLPHLQHTDQDLEQITGKVLAGDGSLFGLAGEVAWAMQRRKNQEGQIDSQVKLNLLVDVHNWTPEDGIVTGADHKGGEPAAMKRMLQGGVVYLFDRAYYPFDFMRAVLEAGSDFVIRLKKDIVFRGQQQRELSEKDRQAGVMADWIGFVGVENGCKGQAPGQMLREVRVWDEKKQEIVRLLTTLLDVEAWVIAALYRLRWVIELFFRWLKVTVGFSHLVSTSPNGITLQFYVAMICTLLIHIRTGLPVSKYSLMALSLVARGQCSLDDLMPVLAKRERERMLERARLERKRAAKKQQALLPG